MPSHAARAPSKQRAFVSLLLLELWERFGYYGVASILLLFMVQELHYDDRRATLTWGALVALIYAAPTLGGWLGDRVLGTRRTMLLGAGVLLVAYTLLAIPDPRLLFPSLGLVAVGNGLFKANPPNLISKLYEGEPAKTDSVFTLYYMSVNVGAAFSQFLTPLLAARVGWHPAFAFCAAGLAVGLLNYFLMRRHLAGVGSPPDARPVDRRALALVLLGVVALTFVVAGVIQSLAVARAVVWAAAAVLAVLFVLMIRKSGTAERRGIVAMLLLTLQAGLFFIFYQQMSTSLTLFAARNVQLEFLGFHIEPAQFQDLNPVWIMVLSPLLAALYTRRGARGADLPLAAKFAWGFVALAIGFFIYGLSGRFAVAGYVSAGWLIAGYFFQSLGELLISGLGMAMVARYIGPRLRGLMYGAWFLAIGISQYAGSVVANLASLPSATIAPELSLALYMRLFLELGAVAVVGVALSAACVPFLKRSELRPEREGRAAA